MENSPLWLPFFVLVMAFIGGLVSLFTSLLVRGPTKQWFGDIWYGAACTALGSFVLYPLGPILDNIFLYILLSALTGYLLITLFLYLHKRLQ